MAAKAGSKPVPIASGLKALINASLTGQAAAEAPTNWVSSSIDSALEKIEEFRVDPGWVHPSALSEKCDGKMAFRFLGVHPDAGWKHTARTRRIFDMGHGRDQSIKGYVSLAGLSVHPRTGDLEKDAALRRIEMKREKVRGEYDDRIRNPMTGEEHILEIKTKNLRLFTKMEAPDESHVIQVQPYLAATGLKSAIVLYECKNDQELKEFKVPFDPEAWALQVERIHMMLSRLDDGLSPALDYRECDGCPFRKRCYSTNWQTIKKTMDVMNYG